MLEPVSCTSVLRLKELSQRYWVSLRMASMRCAMIPVGSSEARGKRGETEGVVSSEGIDSSEKTGLEEEKLSSMDWAFSEMDSWISSSEWELFSADGMTGSVDWVLSSVEVEFCSMDSAIFSFSCELEGLRDGVNL